MNINECEIYPAIENKYNENTRFSKEWLVSHYTRETARIISHDDSGSPNYGGTVNDESVINYLRFLKASGKKIMFYPMIFLDLDGKPWRGDLTGEAADVADFF